MKTDKFIPKAKLSKKKKKELAASGRKTWGGLNPVTRKPKNPKAYNRNEKKRQDNEPDAFVFVIKNNL